MNRRLILVLAVALGFASLTSYVLYHLILARMGSQGANHALAANHLFVAKHDIQVGTFIEDSDVSEVSWSAPIPEEALRSKQDIVGRGAVATIFQNEPFLSGRIAAKGAGAGLAATIPVGMRAVALHVDEVVGLAGFVVPGMHVDVLLSGNTPSDQGRLGTLCRTILQNIEVLSAGQKIEKTNDGKPESAQVVNLLVSPAQAEILNLAMSQKVQLVLRNPLDTEEQATPGTSIAGLFKVPGGRFPASYATADIPIKLPVAHVAKPAAPEPAADAHPVSHIEVFRGIKKSDETFDAPSEKK